MINNWEEQAFNQAPDSKNEIHGDDLAQRYGFKGGLVPGVTISAYLIHPAVERWGLEWLSRGSATVKVLSPLYDEERFAVHVSEQTANSYEALLERPDKTVSASAKVLLPEQAVKAPERRGDRVEESDFTGPAASASAWARLQQNGCIAMRYIWNYEHKMSTYLRNRKNLPVVLQSEAAGYANMSFVLGCSNWVLASNAYMNPWVHLETRSQNYKPISVDTSVIAELQIMDVFERKGHEFVDAQVELYDEADDSCLTSIFLRAIYRLRGM